MCAAERHDGTRPSAISLKRARFFSLYWRPDGEAGAFAQRGDLARRRGDLDTARRLLEQSEAMAREIATRAAIPGAACSGTSGMGGKREAEAGECFRRALCGFGEVRELTGISMRCWPWRAWSAAPAVSGRDTSSVVEAQRERSGMSLPSDWSERANKPWKPCAPL
jgi:hypothetical protein